MKSNKILKFYSKRWIYFALSISIMVIGTICAIVKGIPLDIEFKGGALLTYTYEGKIDENAAADLATKMLDRPVTTSLTTDFTTGAKKIVFNLTGKKGVEASVQKTFDATLKEKFPDNQLKLFESQMVEKYFGEKFLRSGIMAIALASLLVMGYVWIRFKMMGGLSAGVMALVALFHDVFVVFFACVILEIPIGESFVAVALSIIGYSINDTIVIYDRIRENHKTYEKMDVETVVDLSITQSMFRSINTNVAVMISVSLVYFIAHINNIGSIESFALPMAIGSISGCYSTICIAGPLWVTWKKRKGNAQLFVEKSKNKR